MQKLSLYFVPCGKIPTFCELCREFGISRKTGYKWKERFLHDGMSGLSDQSRRPESSPNQLGEDQVCQIIRLKQAHPHWRPRKLREVFARQFSAELVPSESTFKRVLDKAGLVVRRRPRKSQEAGTRLTQPVVAERPNHVWTVDFKGWWYTLDRHRFEPLTIRDDYSRYILCARALASARTDIVRENSNVSLSGMGCQRSSVATMAPVCGGFIATGIDPAVGVVAHVRDQSRSNKAWKTARKRGSREDAP